MATSEVITSVPVRYIDFVIPISTALSQIALVNYRDIVAFHMPAAWTTAGLSFLAGLLDTNVDSVFDASGEITLPAAADRYITLEAALIAKLNSAKYLQIRSGTVTTPVTQAAARTIRAYLR